MQNSHQPPFPISGTTTAALTKDNRSFYLIIATSFVSLLFILSLSATSPPVPSAPATDPYLFPTSHHRHPSSSTPTHLIPLPLLPHLPTSSPAPPATPIRSSASSSPPTTPKSLPPPP
ncbi:hypothetical protein CK203_043921 [Vitis vinifera]|uniref:Uncharacterized protein n=1 Tax=Vitis vinifera TaxID=29760 RepID=A0A438HVD6_VITVI|nr:hypothetical protein CK203_043921 [Vitis vinifera]